jgi:hypothetical protein
MLPLKLPSADVRPFRYCPDGIGNWSGHIPFAFDLVAAVRSGVLVELGTHYGESYFSFCQAIAANGMSYSAFAVDTWQGDLHTGAYGNEVFEEVDAYNRERYKPFSRLLRMPFEEAALEFGAESVDILHIDGLHTYDAVRRDFETWIGKVKPGGIVLMHDTAVRRRDFGVWRFWDELQEQYRTFQFEHSNGLGVLMKPGPVPSGGITGLMFGNGDCPSDAICSYYELCAERLMYWHRNEQRVKGESAFAVQMFWRSEADSFSEACSLTRFVHAGSDVVRVEFSIPPLDPPPAELRLDFSDRPVVLRVVSARLLDGAGQEIWNLETELWRKDVRTAEMEIASATDGTYVLIQGSDSALILSVGQEALAGLGAGGSLVMEVANVEARDQLAAIFSGSVVSYPPYRLHQPNPQVDKKPLGNPSKQLPVSDSGRISSTDGSAWLYLDLLKKRLAGGVIKRRIVQVLRKISPAAWLKPGCKQKDPPS